MVSKQRDFNVDVGHFRRQANFACGQRPFEVDLAAQHAEPSGIVRVAMAISLLSGSTLPPRNWKVRCFAVSTVAM
jgi:hypothetical protein